MTRATARDLIASWWRGRQVPVEGRLRHLYLYGYVVERRPTEIRVALPWFDAEPHLREWNRDHSVTAIRTIDQFDRHLHVGDWCLVAYVRHSGGGELVAVKREQV